MSSKLKIEIELEVDPTSVNWYHWTVNYKDRTHYGQARNLNEVFSTILKASDSVMTTRLNPRRNP
jgi:hypothetical protein